MKALKEAWELVTHIWPAIALIIISTACAYYVDLYRCKQHAQSFEDVQYTVFVGCMVKHNNRWLPLKNIRGFGDE